MDPDPKRTKKLLEQTLDDNPTTTGIDRISYLPDDILFQILSYLPTKYAAGTSTLSTRWKHLFAFIPKLSLDFDDSLLIHPHRELENPNLIPIFGIFVNSVLIFVLNNTPHIYSFSLKCEKDYGDSSVANWVLLALFAEVRELTVQVDNKDFVLFPHRFFYCSSVMRVTIGGRFFFDVPNVVFMPNLRSIFLDCVKFHNGEAVIWLIRGCLFLEAFCLERCEFEELEVLEISSTKLKLLIIINCVWDGEYEVVLDVPNLEFLHYEEDSIAYDYPVKNLSRVREAHIDIGISWEQGEDDGPHYEDNASGFVAACSNLEILSLSLNSLHAIQWSWDLISPTFPNLTTLKLDTLDYCGRHFLSSLLESSPNLEVLEFTGGFTEYEDIPDFVSRLTRRPPQCLSYRIQKVKIAYFNGDENELNVIEFFLKSAEVLREVEISSDLSSEEQLNISKKISLFPKRSAICEIVFTSTEEG